MARFARVEVLNRLVEPGLVPVFHHDDIEMARRLMTACAAAGLTAIEFTNRGDHAIDVFATLTRHCRDQCPEIALGAGTIVDAPTAALYLAHGAEFIVGPSFSEAVARLCNRRRVPYLPGCATATEIADAEEIGVEIVKVFPCESVGGPTFVRAILGPSPRTRILATGLAEVSPASLAEWFKAGVVAVGIGRELFRKELLERRDYDAITQRASEMVQWVRAARRPAG
jgi:2-dehydro-3-deoxyphosphogluconate aldolase/(4S)-4-hydroxy-2-oxoglutarate aldolase